MLAKIRKGQNFYNCLYYATRKARATVLGGNTIGEDARELASEFQDVAALGDRTQKPVYHVSLALPPPEWLWDEQWRSISQRYLEKMGFSNHQYLVVRHADTEHDHIHIIANRVGFDGKCVSDRWDYRRTQQILWELEGEYHLSSHDRHRERRSATTGQIRRIRQEQLEYESGKRLTPPIPTVRSQLQRFIDNSTCDRPTLSVLFERLQHQQVLMRPRFSVEIEKLKEPGSDPTLLGVSFEYRGVHFSGSQLGRAYSLPGLQKYRGVDFDLQRDGSALVGVARGEPVKWQGATDTGNSKDSVVRAGNGTSPKAIQNQHLQTIAPVVAMALHHLKKDRIDGTRYSAYWDEETLILQRAGVAGPAMAARYDESTRQWVGTVSLPAEEVQEFARFQERQQLLLHESQVGQTTVDWD